MIDLLDYTSSFLVYLTWYLAEFDQLTRLENYDQQYYIITVPSGLGITWLQQ